MDYYYFIFSYVFYVLAAQKWKRKRMSFEHVLQY